MKITRKNLSELRHPEKNVRMHTDKQIAEFQRSIQMFGQIRPIVIDENNVVLAGNGLFETLLSLGHTEADCYVVTGLTDKEKKKLMLADNRIFDLGVDDMAAFDSVLAELGNDLDVPGFDEDLLKSLLADSAEVDNIMSSYGLVDDNKKAEISAAQETYAKQEAAFANTPPSTVGNANENSQEMSEQNGNYVICPKCGERIWL